MQTRNTMKTEGCPQRASQPWEQMCFLGDQGSPQHTAQGSLATVDAVSHLGPSDRQGHGNVKERKRVASGQRRPVCREEGFAFPPFLRPQVCPELPAAVCVVLVWAECRPLFISFTPRGFRQMHTSSFNSKHAPGCDWRVLTQGLSRSTASAGSAGS